MKSQTLETESDRVRSSVASWVQRAIEYEKKRQWQVCPICEEEWTKIKPCKFIWDGGWKNEDICVRCGETVKSIHKISDLYPIHELKLDAGFIGPKIAKGTVGGKPIQEVLWRNAYAKLTWQNLVIAITATAHGPMMIKIGDEDPQYADNILAAWSMARNAVSSFCDPSLKETKSEYRAYVD